MAWTIEEAISYYKELGAPKDQNALVALLKEVQKENKGGIPSYYIGMIADGYAVKESLLLALVKRIPSLRLEDKHCLQLCAGPNCGKSKELSDCAETLLAEGTGFELKYVPCMRLCGKGPNLKWDGKLYHRADPALLRELVRE